MAEHKKHAYVVGMTDIEQRKVSLRGAALGAAAGSDAELVGSRRTQHQGYDAITYTARAAGKKGFVVKGLIVRTPQQLFQASVLARKSPGRAYRDFIDSFRIRWHQGG